MEGPGRSYPSQMVKSASLRVEALSSAWKLRQTPTMASGPNEGLEAVRAATGWAAGKEQVSLGTAAASNLP